MAEFQSHTIANPVLLNPVNPAIGSYVRGLVSRTDNPTLTRMETLAREQNFPIVERLVGVFLETLAKSINTKRVFEFGSGYGYSAYWYARAIGNDGKVICTDGDPANKEKAE